MIHRRQQALIDRHFAGTGTPEGEHRLREHLVGCGDCRGRYERHLTLAAVDPGAAVPRAERLARGLGLAPAPRARAQATRRWLTLALSASAACALVLIAVRPTRAPQPRGASATPGSQLLVYEVGRSPAAASARQISPDVTSSIRADSALAFAYANIARRRFLMVFAVDEARRVYWYHPAWETAADNPMAIAVEPDEGVHELPAAVTHRFSGRYLQLWGVFMDRAMSVREMEALVAGAPADEHGGIRLDVAGAGVTKLDLRIEAVR
jgi:hypothetical protein